MSRYIDADALDDSFRHSIVKCKQWFEDAAALGEEESKARAEQAYVTFMECSMRLKKQPTVDAVKFKWISVNDRLPKPRFAREWYLVALESGCVESLAFDRDRNEWWETGSHVTHWMELPEPPNCADGERRTDEQQ